MPPPNIIDLPNQIGRSIRIPTNQIDKTSQTKQPSQPTFDPNKRGSTNYSTSLTFQLMFAPHTAHPAPRCFGLPKAAENFLRYAAADRTNGEPSYSAGQLTKMEQGVLIEGGKVRYPPPPNSKTCGLA